MSQSPVRVSLTRQLHLPSESRNYSREPHTTETSPAAMISFQNMATRLQEMGALLRHKDQLLADKIDSAATAKARVAELEELVRQLKLENVQNKVDLKRLAFDLNCVSTKPTILENPDNDTVVNQAKDKLRLNMEMEELESSCHRLLEDKMSLKIELDTIDRAYNELNQKFESSVEELESLKIFATDMVNKLLQKDKDVAKITNSSDVVLGEFYDLQNQVKSAATKLTDAIEACQTAEAKASDLDRQHKVELLRLERMHTLDLNKLNDEIRELEDEVRLLRPVLRSGKLSGDAECDYLMQQMKKADARIASKLLLWFSARGSTTSSIKSGIELADDIIPELCNKILRLENEVLASSIVGSMDAQLNETNHNMDSIHVEPTLT